MSAITYPEVVTPESIGTPEPVYSCPQCSHWIPEGTLACPDCHTLVYGEHLNRLAEAATNAEREGRRDQARGLWHQALGWLPADARQTAQIEKHLGILDGEQQAEHDRTARWKKRLGPLAPLALGLAKLKSMFFLLFKLKFLLGFVSFFGIYWALFGWKFAVGFTISILIHEMGHYLAARRRGLKADLPMFLPGMAYVRWYHQGVSPAVVAEIALAGPLFGFLAALGAIGLYVHTHAPIFQAVAYVTAWVNLFNLIPVFGFDGAQATNALSRLQRGLLLAACVILFALMHEGVFLFLAAGLAWRLFTNDTPEQETVAPLAGFLMLLFALGSFLYIIPDPGAIAR